MQAIQVPVIADPMRMRASGGTPLTNAGASTAANPAELITRGPLAARAHKLLGLGAVGSAQLGQNQGNLQNAFGGDAASWQQVGNPWIAARSLARPVDSVASQSTSAWLLSGPVK